MKLDPPDAHLRQALRHAPDADLQAPGELSAQILAAAHRAAADGPPRAAARRPWWPWGATWQLGASGALASVLMAGVIGLLWRGEAPGPTREDPTATPAAPSAEPPVELSAPDSAAAEVAAAPPQHTPKARGRIAPVAPVDAKATAAAAPATAPPPPSIPATMPKTAERTLLQPAGAIASWGLSGQRAAADLATTTASAKASQGTLPWVDAAARGAQPTLLQPGAPRAVDAAWLRALAAHTDGRWQPSEAAQPQDSETLLEWRIGEQALGRLWLGPARALWCPLPDPTAACQAAALSVQAAAALKEKLPR